MVLVRQVVHSQTRWSIETRDVGTKLRPKENPSTFCGNSCCGENLPLVI